MEGGGRKGGRGREERTEGGGEGIKEGGRWIRKERDILEA